MNTNIISKYLQLLRKKHNYTQDELAKRLDISRQAVSKWETGTAIPDLEVLLKISKLYGITINDILEPNIPTKKITDFEQLSEVPENELRDILEQYDMTSLVIASMGASPEINNLLEKLFPDVDYKMERNRIGRVRIDEVERVQQEIVSVINLRALDSELL
ncbi:helix-turn-helix domain-containing protein [Lachnospiraceae bacterium KK002]